MKMKKLKKFSAALMAGLMAVVLTVGLSKTPVFAAEDFMLDDAAGGGMGSLNKVIEDPNQDYTYNGWVTLDGADGNLKYLQFDFVGDIKYLRFEFETGNGTKSTVTWFDPEQATHFVSADGGDITTLTADEPTTVTVDLAASGINLADYVAAGGIHIHYGDKSLAAGTSATITNARLTDSTDSLPPVETDEPKDGDSQSEDGNETEEPTEEVTEAPTEEEVTEAPTEAEKEEATEATTEKVAEKDTSSSMSPVTIAIIIIVCAAVVIVGVVGYSLMKKKD